MTEPLRAGHRLDDPVATAGTDDDALVRAALGGDGDAFDELYRRHRDALARTAYLLTRDLHLAQDAAQEAFIVGWRTLERLRDPASFRSWITGIVVNLCRRRRGGFRLLPGPGPAPARAHLPPGHEATQDLDPATTISVRAAVARLPRRLREVVVLRFYADLSEREIAAALGIAVGTVKSRTSRARARLSADLGSETEGP